MQGKQVACPKTYYMYFLTIAENKRDSCVYVQNVFLDIVNRLSSIILCVYGVAVERKPHIHAIIITSKPIKYTFIVKDVWEGQSINIAYIKTRGSLKKVKEYVDDHDGQTFSYESDILLAILEKRMSYAKGRRFEYSVKNKLEKAGFYVVRSAGSHGAFDLVAIRKGIVLGVQCKTNGYLPPGERVKLLQIQELYGIIACIAYRENNRIRIVNLQTGIEIKT